jgi:hypothetical protein
MHTNEPDWTNYEWRPAHWPEDRGRPASFRDPDETHHGFLQAYFDPDDLTDQCWTDERGYFWDSCYVLAPKHQQPTNESEGSC